jgi:predicted DNA-binding transcriptional regulator AlpA
LFVRSLGHPKSGMDRQMKSDSSTKPAAAKRKRAAKTGAARPQPVWLRKHGHTLPPPTEPPPETFERPGGLPKLLDKATVCSIANASFPTIWKMMRDNMFPRSRVCGGKSVWLSTEIESWMRELPRRQLKGDNDEMQR